MLDRLLEIPGLMAAYCLKALSALLLAPASELSIPSLFIAFVTAVGWLSRRHLRAGLPVRARAVLRLVFPRRWWLSRSAWLDARLLLLNLLVFGVILTGAIISHRVVSGGLGHLLAEAFGPASPTGIPPLVGTVLLTVALFLAYELAYWVYHYLSHVVPALWELHKVHHSAEVLTPLTNSRVHPLESLLLLNTMAVFLGVTDGAVTYLLGQPTQQLTIANANLIVVVFTYLIAHLHHTHVWIPFTGFWGKVLISPAHHQIHHSTNPVHFNKNMGSVLAIWDWLFGTLHIPAKNRERLTFGLGDGEVTEHTVTQELFRPVHALAELSGATASPARRSATDDAPARP